MKDDNNGDYSKNMQLEVLEHNILKTEYLKLLWTTILLVRREQKPKARLYEWCLERFQQERDRMDLKVKKLINRARKFMH